VSSAQVVLKATRRTETGKAVSRLRKAGRVPAVVFGHGMDSIPVSLELHDFEHLRRTAHSNTIISLEIDGADSHRVLIHGLQVDPRHRQLLHVDLFALRSGEEVTVELPLHTVGEAFAAYRLGGTLLHTVDRVRVRAMPENLPEALEVSVEPLVDFDTSIHLRDVPLPKGVTLLADLDEVVAKVVAPHVVEEAAAPAAAAEEAPEEAAAPAEEAKPEA
jgi:large subunit ribosomal protein L25